MDGLNLISICSPWWWSAAMIIAPHRFDPPLMMFSVLGARVVCIQAGQAGAPVALMPASVQAFIRRWLPRWRPSALSLCRQRRCRTRVADTQPTFLPDPQGQTAARADRGFRRRAYRNRLDDRSLCSPPSASPASTRSPPGMVGAEFGGVEGTRRVAGGSQVLLIQANPLRGLAVMSLDQRPVVAGPLARAASPMSTDMPATAPFRAQDSAD